MADAYETIRGWILEGTLAPGERLREEQLAERLGVSRTPVREALRRLETEGLVRLIPNRGAAVTAYSTADIRHYFDLRVLLEGYAAAQAALYRTSDDVETLRALTHRFEELYRVISVQGKSREHIRTFTDINQHFHGTVWRASGNPHLPNLLNRIIVVPLVYRSFDQYSVEQILASVDSHRVITKAVAERDPLRAETAMREHILKGRDHALERIANINGKEPPTGGPAPEEKKPGSA
ncbi:GntR family transcriptional regulator [Kyrpidia tusciae]|uniref:Transcriptional regulator, GntR family n=1 Tax=Kyrpidia tusciae (strain DSM 2912 / NBRC 15312 / T2) TaxID=562970 RepID=D5WRB4_KYRT2|nr:GntR family transcriptional regulator [Kyrpidia tusciae]ADG06844.1 transcriptional regulator, GntR family [Kyrpidia tusciae DSM 2912]